MIHRFARLAIALVLVCGLLPGIVLAQDGEETDGADVALRLVAGGFASPVTLVEAPDDSGRLFIVDQVGQIWIVSPEGDLLETPFLDVAAKMVELRPGYDERGLLGLAFHPDYADNGRFFINYSAPLRAGAPEDWNHTAVVSEYSVSDDDPNVADPESEQILLEIDKPQSNHNGGTVAFGPDGYLYISIGDGGGGGDDDLGHVEDWYEANEGGNGQDITSNLMGNILRIDIDNAGDDPYAIPADNPFAGDDVEGLDEIYAYGFRNPYRFSFDMMDGTLYVGDAGQELWEEVSIVEAGGNYGWNVREGTHCFSTETPTEPPADCPTETPDGDPLIDPIIEFLNAKNGGLSNVVVGGYVYYGSLLPDYEGQYIFGGWSDSFDVAAGSLFIHTGDGEFEELSVQNAPNGQLSEFVLGFGQDLDGEMYLLTNTSGGPSGDTGRVYQFVAPGEAPDVSGLPTSFSARLWGHLEAPNPGDPDGFGFARISLDFGAGQICYRLSAAQIGSPSAAHIHSGAAGVAGPVVVPLAPPAEGLSNGCTAVDRELMAAIASDPAAYYVNVHNADYPGGAIRGQLEPIT